MMEEITDFDTALVSLNPKTGGKYVYCDATYLPNDIEPFALIVEAEGPCALIPLEQARAHNLKYSHEILTRISLGITTSVKLSGITGTVARHLASSLIPCNVISGMRHDHLFVPSHRADDAMTYLQDLSQQARGWLS